MEPAVALALMNSALDILQTVMPEAHNAQCAGEMTRLQEAEFERNKALIMNQPWWKPNKTKNSHKA